MKLATHNPFEV